PRRSSSLSSAGRSSCTSENECTSSTAAAAGSTVSASAPTASPVASVSTGRMRLPPSAWRIGAARVPSSGVSERSPRYVSTSSRTCSGAGTRRRGCLGLGGALRPLQLGLDLLRDLGELLENLDRLIGVLRLVQPSAGGLEPGKQVFCVGERFVRGHATSRWIR